MELDLSNTEHHPTLETIVDTLCARTQNPDRGFFRVEVAYFLAKMASSMNATIVHQLLGEIPVNLYVLALAASGYGKGHSVHVLENEYMKQFRNRFMDVTFPILTDQNIWSLANVKAAQKGTDQQEEHDRIEKEFNQIGNYPFTIDSATTPAVKKLRQKLIRAGCGAINLQIDEIGSNLSNNVEVLTLYFELYDQGMVNMKLTMNTADNKHIEELDGKTPANALLFGTPSKLLDGGQTEELFYSLLDAGYARRCLFGIGQRQKKFNELTPEEAYERLAQSSVSGDTTKWATYFQNLADPALHGWKMTVHHDVGVVLQNYKMQCQAAADQLGEYEEMRKIELENRDSKALKLAGAYAFIDQAQEISMENLMSAIKLVEESGVAFQTILNREKAYVKLAKYIAEIGTEVTHADLHEALPFYKSSQQARNEMMTLATAWGYKKHIIIKKSFVDGIELFKGETLQETDLDNMMVSYSKHWAYNYLAEKVPFKSLHVLTQQEDMHWANHHFKDGHRLDENVIPGFNMIVIDVDGGISLNTAQELMREYKFLTYTTKRHTEEENRFRMILPTNYVLSFDQEEYKEFMNCFMDWLPFEVDRSANQRCKKWQTHKDGQIHYNLEAPLIDVLDFIPKTSRNEALVQQTAQLENLDNLERWFAQRIASGNRNNQMIKYALILVDSGWSIIDVNRQVRAFNSKLNNPLSEQEIDSTIMVTVAKRYPVMAA